jgi:hypothetical protein
MKSELDEFLYTNGRDHRLDDYFTPQQHERLCAKVMEYVDANPSCRYRYKISG